jgi:hypothetical protein
MSFSQSLWSRRLRPSQAKVRSATQTLWKQHEATLFGRATDNCAVGTWCYRPSTRTSRSCGTCCPHRPFASVETHPTPRTRTIPWQPRRRPQRRRDHHREQHSEGIHENMAFSAVDLLAAVVAAFVATLLGGFHRLAVDGRTPGEFIAARSGVNVDAQRGCDFVPNAVIDPGTVVVVRRPPPAGIREVLYGHWQPVRTR